MKQYKKFLCEKCGVFITQICSLKRHQMRKTCKNLKKNNIPIKNIKKTFNLAKNLNENNKIESLNLQFNDINNKSILKNDLEEFLIFDKNLNSESKSVDLNIFQDFESNFMYNQLQVDVLNLNNSELLAIEDFDTFLFSDIYEQDFKWTTL